MRKIVFLCFICVFSILQVKALHAVKINQEIKLYGDVYDSFTRIPLHAKLYLLTQDSMLVDSTTTSIEKMRATYSFTINKETRKYIIKSVCKGYYDTFITCEVAPKRKEYLRNYLGNAEMGIGTDNRWLTRLFTLLNGERNTIAIFTNNNNINEDTKPSQNGNWAHADMIKQGVMTTRRIGANIQSDSKNKTIANTLDINTEWNELSSNKIYNSESFSSAGNIFKNGVSYLGNKEKKASVSGEMNITQKSHTSVTYQVNYEDKKAWESQRDSTFRDAVTNNLLEYSLLSHLKTVRLGVSIASLIGDFCFEFFKDDIVYYGNVQIYY